METGYFVSSDRKTIVAPLIVEFIGSIILTLSLFCSNNFFYLRYSAGMLVGWILAVQISGAHFNPALSLAVFIKEGKIKENAIYLIVVSITQICGSFMGILFAHLIIKPDYSGAYVLYFLYPIVNDRYFDDGSLL
jgi:glycerol uptake facilitator-like aquaporin